jgi:hypothetical protein
MPSEKEGFPFCFFFLDLLFCSLFHSFFFFAALLAGKYPSTRLHANCRASLSAYELRHCPQCFAVIQTSSFPDSSSSLLHRSSYELPKATRDHYREFHL